MKDYVKQGGKTMQKKNVFYLLNDETQELMEYHILFTYDAECDNGYEKHYVVYTDNSADEDGCIQATLAVCNYDSAGRICELYEAESEEEFQVAEGLLEMIQEKVRQLQLSSRMKFIISPDMWK